MLIKLLSVYEPDKKIRAIKNVRTVCADLGLREAKELVESVIAGHTVTIETSTVSRPTMNGFPVLIDREFVAAHLGESFEFKFEETPNSESFIEALEAIPRYLTVSDVLCVLEAAKKVD